MIQEPIRNIDRSRLRLACPAMEHEARYLAMMEEWTSAGGRLYPGALRNQFADYGSWLRWVLAERSFVSCREDRVPQELFFLVDGQDELLGAVTLRPVVTEEILQSAGHIGYGIRPSARGKGYAKEQLRLMLALCGVYGLSRVMITCDRENGGSAAVALACGGRLEDEREQEDGSVLQRYWVKV